MVNIALWSSSTYRQAFIFGEWCIPTFGNNCPGGILFCVVGVTVLLCVVWGDVCLCVVWWVGARIARIEVLAQTIRRANGLWDVARKMGVLVGYTTLHLLFSLTIVKQV